MTTDYKTLRFEKAGRVGRLTWDRPGRRNALSREMLRETHHALALAAADRDLSVLVLTGAGGDFCPGADFKGPLAQTATDAAEEPLETEWFRVGQLLHEMRAVTIAAISGACAGAGLSWACACDLRLASDTARFNTAFLDVGASGDMGGIWFVSRLLGAARARELFLTPGKFLAADALRLGLVSSVHDQAGLEASLAALVARLERAPPMALAAMKANLVDAGRVDLASYIAIETERHLRVMGSAESRAAFRARASSAVPAA